jgi:hypothetical protein
VQKIILYSLIVGIVGSAAVYGGEWFVLRIRITRGSGYGMVTTRQYYAVNEKANRTEYFYGSTQDQACVNSLFGHQGMLPCWYLRRHPDRQVQI